MPVIELLWCDGTWAGRGGSPASEALRRSLNHSVKFTYVKYPAMFGPATGVQHMSAAESIAAGAQAMARAVRSDKAARRIIDAAKMEVSLFWIDTVTIPWDGGTKTVEIPCKARLDML